MKGPLDKTGREIIKIVHGKDKVTIYFPNSDLKVPNDVATNFYLYKGKVISNDVYFALIKEIRSVEAFGKAKKYILSGVRSEKEVRDKLFQKDFAPKDIYKAINKLKEYHLIDDENFCNEYVSYLDQKQWGYFKIKNYLLEKGIKLDAPYFPLYIETKELDKAKQVVLKLNARKDFSSYRGKTQKIKLYLHKEGYSDFVIEKVALSIKKKDDEKELDSLRSKAKLYYNKIVKQYEGFELKDHFVKHFLTKLFDYGDILKIWEELNHEIY